MPRAYSMRGVQGAADRAVHLATDFLVRKAPGSLVHDVQEDPRFQHRGVDLLWDRQDGSPVLGVEVKGDRQGRRRGNYFFELISNAEKDAPGCFLYSTADLLLYVFLDVQEVHCLSLPALRDWFVPLAKRYPLKSTRTRTGAVLYTTVGAIVPLRDVKAEVPGALEVFRFAARAAPSTGPQAGP